MVSITVLLTLSLVPLCMSLPPHLSPSFPHFLLLVFSTLSFFQRSGVAPTIFLFVVDTCQDEENLQALKVSPDGLTTESVLYV